MVTTVPFGGMAPSNETMAATVQVIGDLHARTFGGRGVAGALDPHDRHHDYVSLAWIARALGVGMTAPLLVVGEADDLGRLRQAGRELLFPHGPPPMSRLVARRNISGFHPIDSANTFHRA